MKISTETDKSQKQMKQRDRKYETSGQCYLMQSGEAIFIDEVWTHIILQQVAH